MTNIYLTTIVLMLAAPIKPALAQKSLSVQTFANEPVVLRQGLPERRISGSSR